MLICETRYIITIFFIAVVSIQQLDLNVERVIWQEWDSVLQTGPSNSWFFFRVIMSG